MSTYPKVVPQDLEDEIAKEEYTVHGRTTVCYLTLKNGITVTGVNHGSVDPRNFSAELGREYSRKGAIEQMWPMLGFRLADKLALINKAGAPTGLITKLGEPVTYVGTKVVHAIAMTRLDYNVLRGWQLPADENGDDNGYLVQYADGGEPNVHGFTGYVSWSPADVFARSYNTGARLEPETFLTRLEKERDRTVSDLNKLTAFLDGDVSKLTEEAVADLHLQKDIMTQLAFILSKRYDDLTIK